MSARELSSLAHRPYDGALLARELGRFLGELRLGGSNRGPIMRRATGSLLELLDGRDEPTLQERWQAVESELWPEWDAGRGRLESVKQWPWGTAALVISRAVRPGWVVLPRARLSQWLGWLPAEHPLPARYARIHAAVASVEWARSDEQRRRAALLGLRIVLARGYTELEQIRPADLQTVPVTCATGIDVLDAALCGLGVLARTPQRGAQRRLRAGRLSPAELVARSRVPERFRDATGSTSRPTRSGSQTSMRQPGISTTRSSACGSSSTSAIRRSARAPRCAASTCWPSSQPRARGAAPPPPQRRGGPPDRTPVANQRALLLRRHLHLVDRARISLRRPRAAGCAARAA